MNIYRSICGFIAQTRDLSLKMNILSLKHVSQPSKLNEKPKSQNNLSEISNEKKLNKNIVIDNFRIPFVKSPFKQKLPPILP